MPKVSVRYYRDESGSMPVRLWLAELRHSNQRAFVKCLTRVKRLQEMGHELRRPEADLLRDGIYELRVREGSVNFRLLYFFHGREVTILVHALTKEDRVPPADIDRAVARKKQFERAPGKHLGREAADDEQAKDQTH